MEYIGWEESMIGHNWNQSLICQIKLSVICGCFTVWSQQILASEHFGPSIFVPHTVTYVFRHILAHENNQRLGVESVHKKTFLNDR